MLYTMSKLVGNFCYTINQGLPNELKGSLGRPCTNGRSPSSITPSGVASMPQCTTNMTLFTKERFKCAQAVDGRGRKDLF